ncbi:MAG: hypothetical protein M1818_007537 [Claussenomyces sp. TS43310]|nr:MAG: hypothetical protein M1818_007537 [Claussenomyces sp. TS43310]
MHITSKDRLTTGAKYEPLKEEHAETDHLHIWYITGPAGCGKSTVAEYIANALKIPYLEGDNFHPPANIEKMSNGYPLNDQDRWDWLISIRSAALATLSGKPIHVASTAGSSSTSSSLQPASSFGRSRGVIFTCSALKRKYRDVLRIASYNDHKVLVHFIYLHATEQVLQQRVRQRKGHYMGADMVHSQFESLEVPGDKEWDVLKISVDGTKAEVEEEALRRVEKEVRRVVHDDADFSDAK